MVIYNLLPHHSLLVDGFIHVGGVGGLVHDLGTVAVLGAILVRHTIHLLPGPRDISIISKS